MWRVDPQAHVQLIERIGEIRYRIDRFLLMPKHEEWLRRQAFVRQAYASTMIENPKISEAEFARAEAEGALGHTRPDVVNYGQALEFVDFLSSTKDLAVDELLIRQVHWHLTRGLKDDYYLPGQYRTSTNWIGNAGTKVYEPPHQMDVPGLMRDFLLKLRSSALHPLLNAGLAHLHLVAVHPFVDGNGRTARLLATLLLQNGGWGFRNLLSLDAYYQRNRDQYIKALASTLGQRFPPEYDADPWLDFFCQSVSLEASRLESTLTTWQMTFDQIHEGLRPAGLLDRQIDGIIYALRAGRISRRDYLEIAKVSPVTASRDLALLVQQGHLLAEGNRRNRIYTPGPRFRTLAESQQQPPLPLS